MPVEVKNIKSGRTYIISNSEYDLLVASGNIKKYSLIGEAKDIVFPTMKPPKEVQEIIKEKKPKNQ